MAERSEPVAVRRSWLAVAAGALGALAVFDALLGPVLARLGAVSPLFAFRWMFLLSLLEGLLGVALGFVALYRTRPAAGRAGRGLAWTGVGGGAAVLAVAAGWVLAAGDVPPIHDITTRPDDPPAFAALAEVEGHDDAGTPYPERNAGLQRQAYPELAPIALPETPPDAALERAADAARALGWQVVATAPEAGRLEATDTSFFFRFVDDVVVRVRPGEAGGSVVDVRSRSRVGQSDLGANAARIRAFEDALRARVAGSSP